MAEETKNTKSADEEIEKTAEPTAGEEKQPETEKAESDTAAAKEEQPEKKGFFGKKKEKKDKKDEQIEELTDRLKRQMAEFDNFRKRTEKEKAAMFEVGAKSVIEKMLPVIDNFERGLATLSDEEKEQFVASLEELGVKAIEAEGNEFDPNFHNAVMHVEDEQYGENVVAEELQKGYMYRDSVVRHSMVKVAN